MSGKFRRDTIGIAEEAAQWLDALEKDDKETNAAFVSWLRASPRHVEEFLLMTASDRACEALDGGSSLDVNRILTGPNVVSLQRNRDVKKTGVTHVRRGNLGLAAGIAALALGITLIGLRSMGFLGGWHTYHAGIGEQPTIELADGSVIQLNAQSRLKVRFSGERRDVRLLEGEALFKVAHGAGRAFRVEVDNAVIRVLGTQFNVDRRPNATRVAVLEGRVEITGILDRSAAGPAAHSPSTTPQALATTQLSAGETVRIAQNGEISRSKGNITEATAWRQKRIVFRNNTLSEIASEFNRYNKTRQFVITDEAVRAQRFGGTFDADEPESLIAFLRGAPDLTVDYAGNQIVIRRR